MKKFLVLFAATMIMSSIHLVTDKANAVFKQAANTSQYSESTENTQLYTSDGKPFTKKAIYDNPKVSTETTENERRRHINDEMVKIAVPGIILLVSIGTIVFILFMRNKKIKQNQARK